MALLNESPLTQILQFAKDANYRFTAVTPKTHEIILRRRPDFSNELRDIFGWNTYFLLDSAPQELREIFREHGFLDGLHQYKKSPVRIASFETDVFLHSAYPTIDHDSVFFGPDTYRFMRFIQQTLHDSPRAPAQHYRILDIGCGSGAGGIAAARALQGHSVELVMNDINPTALTYAKVNAQVAGIPITTALGDAFAAVEGNFDLIISNPPFLCDASERAYRHGGNNLGRNLSVRITRDALQRLNPGGRYILYTGVVITGGEDPFLKEIQSDLEASGHEWAYQEIDPDIFGDELEQDIYAEAERIAAVGLVVTALPAPAH